MASWEEKVGADPSIPTMFRYFPISDATVEKTFELQARIRQIEFLLTICNEPIDRPADRHTMAPMLSVRSNFNMHIP